MRAMTALTLATLVSAAFVASAAVAGEATYLTPPLFREQARDTQKVRRVSDLTTTPNLVVVAKPLNAARTIQIVADAEATAAR
ncbi:hypothetical protein ASF22_11360 [Methylobacterium sp. Leaf87]|jgi:hypothetical protein|uniref:hypothetical protein n=1 Tax=Methylobacterium sp. Leaf87 TaxID=1736243 RepID=UPI0006F447FB|nr:hypothetical protein [Methylobacterium sp. Leaf87]KQO55207.1 hypothetical protein ASF22_11360 [Methylobacterium sp. Leaf87]